MVSVVQSSDFPFDVPQDEWPDANFDSIYSLFSYCPVIKMYQEFREALIIMYLQGYLVEEGGLPKRQYFTEDEFEDRQARMLLADSIRRGVLSKQARDTLAEMLDPRGPSHLNPRQFKLAFRKRGRQREHERQAELAMAVSTEVQRPATVEQSVAIVAERYGLSEDAVWKAWKGLAVFFRKPR